MCVLRRALLVMAVATSLGADVRVAPFRLGLTDLRESTVGVLARDDGFGAITLRQAPSTRDMSTIRYTPADISGKLIPAAAIDLVSAPGLTSAHVAAAGTGAMLGWTAGNTAFLAPLSHDLHLGSVKTLGPTELASKIACNSSRCLAAWTAPSGQLNAMMTDVSANEVARISIRPDTSDILADPSGFLLIGYDGVTHIDQSGAATFVARYPERTYRAIAGDFDGNQYVLALLTSGVAGSTNSVATLDLQGQFSIPIQVNAPLSDRATLTWNGQEHLLVLNGLIAPPVPPPPGVGLIIPFTQPSNLFVARLSRTLDFLTAPIQITLGLDPKLLVNAAWNGAFYDIAYDAGAAFYFANGSSINPINVPRLALVSTETGLVSDQAVSIGPVSQRPAALATSDHLRLAVWLEHGADDPATFLRAARMTSDGRRLDDTPIALDSAANLTLATTKAVAAIGDDFLVAFTKDQRPAAILVHADGRFERIALPYVSGEAARVVANDRSWFIVAMQQGGMGAVRVSQSGVLLTPSVGIIGPANSFDVASDGERFAVVSHVSDQTIFQLFNADFTRVDKHVEFVDSGAPHIAGSAAGYVVVLGTNLIGAQKLSPNGDPLSGRVLVMRGKVVVDVQPYSGGWLVHALNAGEEDLVHVNGDTLAVIATLVETSTVQAIAGNSDGSVSELRADVIDEKPFGIGVAQVLHEIAPGHPRRHETR